MKNATEHLINKLFEGNKEKFISFFIESCLFIPKKAVKDRAKEMLESIKKEEKIPIRRIGKDNGCLFYTENNRRRLDKKDWKKVKEIAKKEDVIFKREDGKLDIKISIDGNGNQAVVAAIKGHIGLNVNTFNSSIKDYTISHIWQKTTHHPLYFSSLWNIVVIPNMVNYIMDKPAHHNEINEEIQELMKAICIELYNPNELMGELLVENVENKYREKAKSIIQKAKITFLDELNIEREDIAGYMEADNKELIDINKLGNKEFIFQLLEYLKENELLEESLDILTDEQQCRSLFQQYYPILLEKNGANKTKDDKDRSRYYSNEYFEFQEKKYFVVSEWYGKNERRTNKRNNRELFITWVENLLDN